MVLNSIGMIETKPAATTSITLALKNANTLSQIVLQLVASTQSRKMYRTFESFHNPIEKSSLHL